MTEDEREELKKALLASALRILVTTESANDIAIIATLFNEGELQ